MSLNKCPTCGEMNGIVNTTVYQCACIRAKAVASEHVCKHPRCNGLIHSNGDGLETVCPLAEPSTPAAEPPRLPDNPEQLCAWCGWELNDNSINVAQTVLDAIKRGKQIHEPSPAQEPQFFLKDTVCLFTVEGDDIVYYFTGEPPKHYRREIAPSTLKIAWKEIAELRRELVAARNAIKLIIGRNSNTPWTEVCEEDVDSYINADVLKGKL